MSKETQKTETQKTNAELWAELEDCDCVLCAGPKNMADVLMLAIAERKAKLDRQQRKEE